MNNQVTSPEAFFGFQLGADRKIAAWDKIVAYLRLLEQESGCLRVIEMGPSTEGNPFLLAFISSPQNLANLTRLQTVNAQISYARGLSEDASEVPNQRRKGRTLSVNGHSRHGDREHADGIGTHLRFDNPNGCGNPTHS